MLLHPNDNVGLALTKIKENCSFENVIAQENIPAGHKIALAEIQKGEPVRKYNQTIGFASEKINTGDHVHTHNIELRSFERLPEVGGVKNKINKPTKSANFFSNSETLFPLPHHPLSMTSLRALTSSGPPLGPNTGNIFSLIFII